MNVAELIDRLSEYDPNTEVRLATQPNYPFEYSIGNVVSDYVLHYNDGDNDEIVNGRDVVYIAEGEQIGYLNGNAIDWLGWWR